MVRHMRLNASKPSAKKPAEQGKDGRVYGSIAEHGEDGSEHSKSESTRPRHGILTDEVEGTGMHIGIERNGEDGRVHSKSESTRPPHGILTDKVVGTGMHMRICTDHEEW